MRKFNFLESRIITKAGKAENGEGDFNICGILDGGAFSQHAGGQRNTIFNLPLSENHFTIESGGAMSYLKAQQQPRARAQAPEKGQIFSRHFFGKQRSVNTFIVSLLFPPHFPAQFGIHPARPNCKGSIISRGALISRGRDIFCPAADLILLNGK